MNTRSIATVVALALSLTPALAQDADGPERPHVSFFDEEDGQLDMSDVLMRGGFIPMPIIITEPAVDGGFGIAAYFVRNPEPGSKDAPTRTILGGVKTGNDSEMGGFLRQGSLRDGSILYRFGFGGGSLNLDFYPGEGDTSIGYNQKLKFAMAEARYVFGDSGISAGSGIHYRRGEVSVDQNDLFPDFAGDLSNTTTLVGLNGDLHFDNRDNPITPTAGSNMALSVKRWDDAFGSDRDFWDVTLTGTTFHSWDDWTLAGMVMVEGTSGDAPFYMEPGVNIRGVPYGRYQGDRVLSSEIELRRQLTPRWAVVGFGGAGHADGGDTEAFSNSESALTWGAGIRYRIARKLGIDVGLDIARGPEDTVFYIQFGHAWGHQMD